MARRRQRTCACLSAPRAHDLTSLWVVLRSIKALTQALRHPSAMDAFARNQPRDLWSSLKRTPPLVALTSPLIYSLIIPFVLTDLWVSLYQAVCFRVYGIEQVERRIYFKLDRTKLDYLNQLEKLNCLYCSYVNGVVAFVREVSARSEQYWCPIKHETDPPDPHQRYAQFSAYGADIEHAVRRSELRAALKRQPHQRVVTPAVRPIR